MNIEKFWSMIEEARQQSKGDIESQHKLLINSLLGLLPEDIQEFNHTLWDMMNRAYRADLWEAVSLVACYCGDDGFEEFQNWLIAQGQATFEKVLQDPENLADIVDKEQRLNIFDGRMASIAREAYEMKTKRQIPESGYPEATPLVGGPLLSEKEVIAKFPRLYAKFGECD